MLCTLFQMIPTPYITLWIRFTLFAAGSLCFLLSVISLAATESIRASRTSSTVTIPDSTRPNGAWILSKLKGGGIEIVKLAFAFTLGCVAGILISQSWNAGSTATKAQHHEHKPEYRCGPPCDTGLETPEEKR